MTVRERREVVEFVVLMCHEYPITVGLADTLIWLMARARQHARLQERACNEDVPEGHDADCEREIVELCKRLPGCKPVFSGDPRGCTVKLALPSDRTNDFGGEGVCVPQ